MVQWCRVLKLGTHKNDQLAWIKKILKVVATRFLSASTGEVVALLAFRLGTPYSGALLPTVNALQARSTLQLLPNVIGEEPFYPFILLPFLSES